MMGRTLRGPNRGLTGSDQIVDILNFDHVAEQETTPLTLADRTVVLVFIEYHAGRVDDPEAALQLDRLQVLGMSRLCCNCARLANKRTFRTQRRHANERRGGPWIASES